MIPSITCETKLSSAPSFTAKKAQSVTKTIQDRIPRMPVRGPVRGAMGEGEVGGGGSHYHGESSAEHSLSLEERKER